MAKVITSILKFPPNQAQEVLEKEDSKVTVSICVAAEKISVSVLLLIARDCPLSALLTISHCLCVSPQPWLQTFNV